MKRVDIKATAVLKGQGPKMLTEYYEYWKKHDTLFNYVIWKMSNQKLVFPLTCLQVHAHACTYTLEYMYNCN